MSAVKNRGTKREHNFLIPVSASSDCMVPVLTFNRIVSSLVVIRRSHCTIFLSFFAISSPISRGLPDFSSSKTDVRPSRKWLNHRLTVDMDELSSPYTELSYTNISSRLFPFINKKRITLRYWTFSNDIFEFMRSLT
jgi:hypothetical protein